MFCSLGQFLALEGVPNLEIELQWILRVIVGLVNDSHCNDRILENARLLQDPNQRADGIIF
jgi:hypothetical protein